MARQASQLEASEAEPPASSQAASERAAGQTGPDPQQAKADRRLVQRCVAGDVAAWEELYAQCHPSLLTSIEVLMGAGPRDPHVVDEIAARVWYAVVANDGELLGRYDPGRGARLITFLRAIAKDEISRHFRTERRRLRRELEAYRERPHHDRSHPDEATLSMHEFFDTLTPHEREFCDDHLLSTPQEGGELAQNHSESNTWQLAFRIRKKLRAFLGFEL